MEIAVTWGRAARVWLAYFWRNIIALVVAVLLAAVAGAILGFAAGLMGLPIEAIQISAGAAGFVIGVLVSIVPMKLILGKDFGDFRLVLVSKSAGTNPLVSGKLQN